MPASIAAPREVASSVSSTSTTRPVTSARNWVKNAEREVPPTTTILFTAVPNRRSKVSMWSRIS